VEIHDATSYIATAAQPVGGNIIFRRDYAEGQMARDMTLFVGKDADSTFHGQGTYVLPVPGKPGAFIFMADRWQPTNAIDGRHIWLPIQFKDGTPFIEWLNAWDLSFFER
jgi:hypothetical protein